MITLRIREGGKSTLVTFTGDVGRYDDVILRLPEVFPQADYIICESAYGNTLHDQASNSGEKLLHWTNRTCIEKPGKPITPAFSFGRTQEIPFWLNPLELERRLPHVKFFVDSPLSMQATQVVKNHMNNFNETIKQVLIQDQDPFDFAGLYP